MFLLNRYWLLPLLVISIQAPIFCKSSDQRSSDQRSKDQRSKDQGSKDQGSLDVAHWNKAEWSKAEQRSKNSIVQVWVNGTEFNWIYPFKSPEQKGGAGTGFFIDKKGHILTNYHVVAGAKSVLITVPEVGRTPLECSIVGVCPDIDVALLKLTQESRTIVIEACGFINALECGDSDALYKSQRILLQGFPLGYRTIKLVSGDIGGRDFLGGRSLIQVPIPTNGGNSGGPYLNHDGKVVAIHVAGWKQAQNYNYCVPINDVLIVLSDLYKTPFVRRPDFSIGANRGTAAHARSLSNPVPSGLYVNCVLKHSMEDKAGIKVGDMIYEVSVNDATYKVDEFGEVQVPWRTGEKVSVQELLSRCRIGDIITCTVYRQGVRMKTRSTFANQNARPIRYIYPEYEPDEIDYEMIGGLVVMQLRANHIDIFEEVEQLKHLTEFREYARLENQSKEALVITNILRGSQAHLSECLMTGFILDKVNGKAVTNLNDFRQALMLSTKTGAIVIETKDRYATVLDLKKVVQDEERLAHDFRFPITATTKKLMAASVK